MDTAQPDGSASGSWAQIRPLGAAKGPPGPPKGCFWAKTDPFGGPRSSAEVSEGAQAHGMDASYPSTMCEIVLDDSRPPSAVPSAQRGPKRAPKLKRKCPLAVLGPEKASGVVNIKT